MLFVQRSRDAFGTPAEIRPLIKRLRLPATLYVVEGGDHSLKVPKSMGVPQERIYETVMDENRPLAWATLIEPVSRAPIESWLVNIISAPTAQPLCSAVRFNLTGKRSTFFRSCAGNSYLHQRILIKIDTKQGRRSRGRSLGATVRLNLTAL
jgi:hypothetical protein